MPSTHSMDEMVRAGCTTPRGVRHWEDLGLLGEVQRTNGGTRRYSDNQIDRARIIASASFGGWKLDEIKAMLDEYNAEVFEAIVTRLSDQARAAARLCETLPRPAAPAQEYDL